MCKSLGILTLISLLGMFGFDTYSQVTRVAIENPCGKSANYIDVYEYDYVEEQPQFPGGDRGLINYINSTREYPYEAYEHRIQGRVICSFVVNSDGTICNISILSRTHPLLNHEAVRIIKGMPAWRAGKMRGENVPVRCILPIAFRL